MESGGYKAPTAGCKDILYLNGTTEATRSWLQIPRPLATTRYTFDARRDPVVLDTNIIRLLDSTRYTLGYHSDMYIVCSSLNNLVTFTIPRIELYLFHLLLICFFFEDINLSPSISSLSLSRRTHSNSGTESP